MTYCAILPMLIEQAGIAFCDAHPALVELAGPVRVQRAFQIAMRGEEIQQIREGEFLINAHQQHGLYYYLSHEREMCSCPDFRATQMQSDIGMGICAHTLAVRFWLDGHAAFTQFQHEYDAAFANLDQRADGSELHSAEEHITIPAWLIMTSTEAEVSA